LIKIRVTIEIGVIGVGVRKIRLIYGTVVGSCGTGIKSGVVDNATSIAYNICVRPAETGHVWVIWGDVIR
jgi:hypothetical protein